jgi:hypothetical protein
MNAEYDNDPSMSTVANPPDSLPFPRTPLPPLPAKWSAPAADAHPDGVWREFDKLTIRCTMTMCDDGLHCYRLTRKLATMLGPGTCRECHRPLVSLQRTSLRSLRDVDHTFSALQTEAIRHFFWHIPFGQRALDYARRAGRRTLHERIPGRICSRIGKAQPYNDGRQTPISRQKADALDFALHAVAACCRTCASYWHGIEKDRELTHAEVVYLSELVGCYLDARLPELPDDSQRVTRNSRSSAAPGRERDYEVQARLPADNLPVV